MADIRINALATTAASTASDDFIAVDGSANGTRKLNAYSPTFGGNLTVSGTGTSSVQSTTGFSVSAALPIPVAGFSVGTTGTGGSLLVQTPSLNANYGSGFAVDGSYSSSKSVINLTAFGVQSGGSYGADMAFRTSNQGTISEWMRLTYQGNLLIGTTTDGGQTLQVNGTAYVSGDATFAGQINILNSNSYLKADSSNLVYETYAGKGHQFKTGGTTALTLDSSQNIVPGTAALATSATNGFIYLQTCAGTPTGVPTTHTGRVASIYDTTNNKLYIYNGGWKSVTLA